MLFSTTDRVCVQRIVILVLVVVDLVQHHRVVTSAWITRDRIISVLLVFAVAVVIIVFEELFSLVALMLLLFFHENALSNLVERQLTSLKKIQILVLIKFN